MMHNRNIRDSNNSHLFKMMMMEESQYVSSVTVTLWRRQQPRVSDALLSAYQRVNDILHQPSQAELYVRNEEHETDDDIQQTRTTNSKPMILEHVKLANFLLHILWNVAQLSVIYCAN
jgi:hypothetical protein